MVKKKNLTAAASSTSGGAAAKSSSNLPKGSAPDAPPPAPTPPAPPGSIAKPGDWIASTITKRDEKRSRSLGLISSDEGNVIFPDKVRLQTEVKSSSSKLDGAIQKAAAARQKVDSLKEELGKLKEKLKEEKRRGWLPKLGQLKKMNSFASLQAANIPADALDKVPNNSPANGVSMTLASHQLTRELLEKGKGAMARMHSMIFPKIKQDKTLGQLIDAFAVDTKEVIEVFPAPAFVDDSSSDLPEGDRIQRMKDRIDQMEKDLRSTYALAASR
ncbi:hypothetical protein QYE76_045703 [Lolium multiflorum]|uniref:Uncharacterized protein n=1 Tax=Lolium multiflorum TaxID=4521 RepID=A0AAD8WXY3_LOLMU|nr:hypothetical protein QYE76_045703 [Lolium multiflorum]